MSEILDAVKYVTDNKLEKEANILACKVGNIYVACYMICKNIPLTQENIDICRKIFENERKTKIMPDEVLVSMENQIIERFMDRLKGLLFSDPRIHKADAFYAVDNVNKAAISYNRLYKKETNK